MGQISSLLQGHLDTLTLVKTQTDCRLVVKNDQLGLFIRLWLHRTGHRPPAAHWFLKMHFMGGFVM